MKQYLTVLLIVATCQLLRAQTSLVATTFKGQTLGVSSDTTWKGSSGNYLFNKSDFEKVPNIHRQFSDFYKLVPFYNNNSFLGYNPYYNRYTLNGLVINNSLGFDGILAGDQANTQLVSMQAIDAIGVYTSPINLAQSGFTGALVELSTKSGSNNLEGSAYSYFSSAGLVGDKINGQSFDLDNYLFYQGGFDFGGAIIKNKLFYYASFETEQKEQPGSAYKPLRGTEREANESRVQADDLEFVSAVLTSLYDYDPGGYEGFSRKTASNKALLRLDWNIQPTHKLSLTYNFLNGESERNASSDVLGHRGPDNTVLQFSNSGYIVDSRFHGLVGSWDSDWGEGFSNKFKIGFSSSNDERDPMSSPFPTVNIKQNGTNYIVAGHDPFSAHNIIKQNTLQVENQITYEVGYHALKAGLSFERFGYNTSFNFDVYEANSINYYGGTYGSGFTSMNDFFLYVSFGFFDPVVGRARQAYIEKTLNNSWDIAENSFGQISFYIQDDVELSNKFSISYGLRIDKPTYFNTDQKIQEAIDRKGGIYDPSQNNFEGSYSPQLQYFDENGRSVQLNHTEMPEAPILISPRVSVSYEAPNQEGLRATLYSGVFSGRVPGNWMNNQVDNSDYFNYMILGSDFRIPQVWRNSLDASVKVKDFEVKAGLTYSMDINAPVVRNYGLNTPSGALAGVDPRLYYTAVDLALDPSGNPGQNAFVLDSESKGRSLNAHLSVQRAWMNGYFFMITYNYLDAKNINSMDSPILSDAFGNNALVDNSNQTVLSTSKFGNQHRLLAFAGKSFTYGEMETRLSILGEINKGGRYDYTYAGDANGDGFVNNDLLYIPTSQEIANYVFTGSIPLIEAQKAALNDFINKDPYMSSRRGQYVERDAVRMPWQLRVDLKASQVINWGDNSLEFSIDIINVHNMINSEWRPQKLPLSTQPLGIFVNPATREPIYFFDLNQRNSYIDNMGVGSRWQMRLGLKYTF